MPDPALTVLYFLDSGQLTFRRERVAPWAPQISPSFQRSYIMIARYQDIGLIGVSTRAVIEAVDSGGGGGAGATGFEPSEVGGVVNRLVRDIGKGAPLPPFKACLL